MTHDIVTRIVAREGVVTVERAAADSRPLVFVHGEDPELSRIYREEGLNALLTAVAREIYRGTIHIRSRSAITRLMNNSLQRMTLDKFKALDEDSAAGLLAAMTEKKLLDRDYDSGEELRTADRLLREQGGGRL